MNSKIHRDLLLCTNAFHSMEESGGELTITLKNVDVDARDYPHENDIQSGLYIELRVSDTGHGIDFSLQDKIFELYFTTKEVGKGTDLGLAIIHGIIKSYLITHNVQPI